MSKKYARADLLERKKERIMFYMKLLEKIQKNLHPYVDHIGILGLALVMLALWRFDLSYSLSSYRVQPGDTLWTILTEKVFHKNEITRLSLEHLESQFQKSVNLNHIEANTKPMIQNGDVITIKNNQLQIVTAGQKTRIAPIPILPDTALQNHFLQVAFYNLLVLVGFLIFLPVILAKHKHLEETKKSSAAFLQRRDLMIFGVICIPLAFFMSVFLFGLINALTY